mgnify:CR=1 FL=1
MVYSYLQDNRIGDHICYISDLGHMRRRLRGWDISRSLDDIFEEIVEGWRRRLAEAAE